MKSLAQHLAEYKQEHSASIDKMTLYIAIPAIAFGTLMLLSWISIGFFGSIHVTFAWLAVAALVAFYYFLDKKLAGAMAVVLIIATAICSLIAYPHPSGFSLVLFLILFVGGWAMLFLTNAVGKSKYAVMGVVMSFPIALMFLLIKLIRVLKLESYFNLPG